MVELETRIDNMKVTLTGNYKYMKIEFCCEAMGDLVMNNFLQTYPHSDHHPIFYVLIARTDEDGKIYEHMDIKYCPYCGAKIEGNYSSG